jgi:hypothetical protein
MTIQIFACMTCRHYNRNSWQPTCTAFPDEAGDGTAGIPDSVLVDGNPHVTPIDGDHGIHWEVARDAPQFVKLANYPFPAALEV